MSRTLTVTRSLGVAVLTCTLAPTSGCGEDARVPYRVRNHDTDAGVHTPLEPPATSDASAGTGNAGEPSAPPGGCEGGPELRVLFIGNSHTYTNDLPSLVRELSCAAGTQVIAQSSTPAGVGFIEHAADPNTAAAIEADAWDLVIMQDQQQRPGHRLEDVEAEDVPALLSLVDTIEQHREKTQPLLYMVWARIDGDTTNCDYYPLACSFETSTLAVSQGYRLHAERTGALVAPVALAWAAVRADPKSPIPPAELWNADGYHPAPPGSYLAAAVLVGTALELPTAKLGYDGGLAPELAAYLRRVADRVVKEERADPRLMTHERVRIDCPYGAACSDVDDATAVSFSLSTDDCDTLAAGEASVRARIDTTLSCRDGSCTTVALAGWHELEGGTIEDGDYQVHAQVDVNGDGELGEGDLEACDSGNFAVGGGRDLLFTELSAR